MSENPQRQPAILLVGPTGSGKTPLGDWLETQGLWSRRCHHFDFGASLRGVATGAINAGLTSGQVQFVRDVLEKGALLENETFHLALKILEAYVNCRHPQPGDLLLLNGLPRHVGQAVDVDRVLDVRAVMQLECDAATAHARVLHNSGGDRAVRTDDDLEQVNRRLAIFATRTLPLLEHYRQRGAPVIRIPIGVATQPPDVARELDRMHLTTPLP